MKPAFIMAMVAQGPPSKRRNATTRAPPARKPPRKRVRISELTQKYRAGARDNDEALLIGDNLPTPTSEAATQQSRESHPLPTHSQHAQYHSPVRFSRFPSSWQEAVTQVTTAVTTAAADGHDRIRVDVKTPELIYTPPNASDPHSAKLSRAHRRIARLVECANSTLREFLIISDSNRSKYAFFTPQRGCLFFNNEHDAEIGKAYLEPSLRALVDVHVLDDISSYSLKSTISVLIAPSNRHGNPSHIEAVERVHYSSWNDQKLVIMLNPDLMALSKFTSFGEEPRQPCFLGDYLLSYYLDPVAFPTKTATGAVLRCFPRKWEMYLLKVHNNMGFRLVAEQKTPPSPERIRCEFSWRIENDMETQRV
ncbi:hypothetical protein BWQ96_01677 [Gracilariopsis chorda]|uniref:DUF1995 domain-containing protein n=1 Tax=Gracilariopsis chorda TaxID=448386 RepID=A0A2V3J287_9FLOR|nr:hypothetical protein BWQ96_01677 [Gracilariopsis chorda]|eukprot:PXF48508.1 hypothetical protein BWQ96_01677 [Gracilariopsis chorda]